MIFEQVTCKSCGAVFETEDGVCSYCHSAIRFAGSGIPAEKTKLQCPRCMDGSFLYELVYRGVKIDTCPRCEGSWYDIGELEVIIHNARKEALSGQFEPSKPAKKPKASESPETNEELENPKRAYIQCPHCSTHMSRKNWEGRSGIIVDWCGLHGIWVDGGELQRLRAWGAQTPHGPPPPLQKSKPPPSAISYTPKYTKEEAMRLIVDEDEGILRFLWNLFMR